MKKCLITIIITYLLQFLQCKEPKILQGTYNDDSRAYNLEIYLDNNDIYNLYEPINQNLQFTWTSSNMSISNLPTSSYIKDTSLTIANIPFQAREYKKDITLNKSIKASVNFNFFHINSFNKLRQNSGGFGFSYKFNDFKYSLIHRLKEQNKIDHLSYAIIPPKTTKGSFYFGGIPFNLTKDSNINSCRIDTNYATWGCNLTKVLFGNVTTFDINKSTTNKSRVLYDNTEYSYFQAGIRDIIAPVQFMHYLSKNIFLSYIESNRCICDDHTMEIICQISVIRSIPDFNFVFDNKFALIFNKNHLFDCTGSFCSLIIHKNTDQQSNDWILGTNFIRRYAMLFDYEKASITFYATKDFVNLDYSSIESLKFRTIKCLYWVLILMLLNICVLLLWIKFIFFTKQYFSSRDQFIDS